MARDSEQEARRLCDRWFRDHRATFRTLRSPDGEEVVWLQWAEPGTGINRVDYLFFGSVLQVCGDLGEATYQWSSRISPEFVAGCHVSYFRGKCQASPAGRGWPDWSEEDAKERLEHHFQEDETEYAEELAAWEAERTAELEAATADGVVFNDDLHRRLYPEPAKPKRRAAFDELGGWDHLHGRREWEAFLHEHHGSDELETALAGDWWEWAPNAGDIPDPRLVAHLEGVKRAVAHLQTETRSLPEGRVPPALLALTRAELEALPVYELSLPTGTTPGTRFRRRGNRPDEAERWFVGEYLAPAPETPDVVPVRWYEAHILEARA